MVNQHASFFGGPRHAVSRKAGAHKRAAHDGAHLSTIVFTRTAVFLPAQRSSQAFHPRHDV